MAIQRDYNPETTNRNTSWAESQQSRLINLRTKAQETDQYVKNIEEAIKQADEQAKEAELIAQNSTNVRKAQEAKEKAIAARKAMAKLKKQQSEQLTELYSAQAAVAQFTTELVDSGNDAIVQAAEEQITQQDEMKDSAAKYNAIKTRIAKNKKRARELKKQKDLTDAEQAELDALNQEIADDSDKISDLKAKHRQAVAAGEEGNEAIRRESASLQGIFGNGVVGTAWNAATSSESSSNTGKILDKKLGDSNKIISGIATVAGKILDVTTALRSSINGWVDEAASVLSANVGKINAALEGTGVTWKSSLEDAVAGLGLSRFVKQTDYISQIANLTAQGITYNVEQRALLETIKDKTVASFNATNANLLRLIRIQQTDLTAAEFGLEAVLKSTLNSVFKDSTYLYSLYDTISGAITDATVTSGESDTIAYNSVIQTWMGALYEAGVNSDTVSKIANGLNYLGSGNVSALASDESLQRLILLSMDSIGMDYADILQQGLSTSDVNDLMTAMVDYLKEIASNTEDNNVLTSSYTNLFNMSMSDLRAFTNLSSDMLSKLQVVNTSTAISATNTELSYLQSTERTIASEQIDNMLANAKFTFGNEIAGSTASYITWKTSNLLLDVFNSVIDSVGSSTTIGKAAQLAALVPELAIFGTELKGIIGVASALFSGSASSDNLQTYINGTPSYGGNSTSIGGAITTTGSSFKTVNNIETLKTSSAYTNATTNFAGTEWTTAETEIEDKELEEVKKITAALVQAEANEAHKAFATYLVGMTDDTLRSFASIFADEDAMAETFSGDNEVLKENLFKYADDTTSNSTTSTSTNTTSV